MKLLGLIEAPEDLVTKEYVDENFARKGEPGSIDTKDFVNKKEFNDFENTVFEGLQNTNMALDAVSKEMGQNIIDAFASVGLPKFFPKNI